MDAGPVLQQNVSTTFRGLGHQQKCSQVDGLTGVEDDLQVGVANQHSGSSRFDKVYSKLNCKKQKGTAKQVVSYQKKTMKCLFLDNLK